jgi:hypothetical protein
MVPDGVTADPWGKVTGTSTIVSGTDNSAAFLNWHTWAVGQSNAGLPVCVKPRAGQYNVNGGLGEVNHGFTNIDDLKIDGSNGVTWQNTYDAKAPS